MAITAEALVFQLSAKLTGFEGEVHAAASVFDRATAKIEAGFGRMDRRIEESTRSTRVNMKALIAAATGALGVREVIQYADAWAKAKNALTSARVPAQQQGAVLERLYEQSQRYSTELNAQVSLFGNVSRAASGLTDSQEDLFRFTEAVAASLKADGQSAAQAAGPLLQLGQALRSPVIQAEEFNSLIDGAPALLEAAARGISKYSGNVTALIRDAKDGELASRTFFEGILAGSDELQARVGASADTFEGAFQRIENALTKYIGSTDEGLSASQRLIDGLNAFADNFDNLADTALKLASIIAGALVGKAIGGLAVQIPLAILAVRLLRLASIGAAQGASFMAANFGGATTAIASATVASKAFRIAALGFFAGPIGLLIGGLATSMISLDGALGRTSDSMEDLDEEMERLGISSRKAASGIKATDDALAALTQGQVSRRLRQIDDELNALLTKDGTALGDLFSFTGLTDQRGKIQEVIETADLLRGTVADMFRSSADLSALDDIRKLAETLQNDGAGAAQTVIDRLDELATTDVSSETDKLIQSLEGAARRLLSLTAIQGRYNDEVERGVTAVSSMEKFREAENASMESLRDATARGQSVLDERTRRANLDPTEREIEDRMTRISEEIEKAGKSAADSIEGAGVLMSKAAIRAQAENELRSERERDLVNTNSDDAISRYVSRVIGAESGGDRFAKNPDSSATGLGQFIESTWIDLFRRYFPDRAAGLTDAAVLAFRTNADDSKKLIEAYARENGEALQRAGIAVTEANLQLSHFLGVGDAKKVLSAAPGTPLAGLINSNSIKANPTILGGGSGRKYEAWEVIGKTSEGRLVVVNPEGGLSTEITQTVEDPVRGGYVNIPSLYGGKPVSEEEALNKVISNRFRDPDTGRLLRHFNSIAEAEKEATARSSLLSSDPLFKRAEANYRPSTGGKTVDDAIDYANRRAGETRVAAGDLTPSEEATQRQIEKRKELKQTIDDLFASTDEQTKMMLLETSLMNANASERERSLTVARLEADLKRAGIPITDELRAAILRLAEARGIAASQEEAAVKSLQQLQDAEQVAIEQMDAFREGARDVLGGFVSDLRQGKTAAEALGNALANIGDRLLNSGLDILLDSLLGAQGSKPGTGLLGGLGSALGSLLGPGRASGGSVQAGKLYPVGENGIEFFAPGRSGTIIPNHNLPSLQAPQVPTSQSAGGSTIQATYAPNIDMRGASVEAVARLEQMMVRDKAEFSARVVKTVRDAQRGRQL